MQRLNHEKPDKRVWSGLVGMKGSVGTAEDGEMVMGNIFCTCMKLSQDV